MCSSIWVCKLQNGHLISYCETCCVTHHLLSHRPKALVGWQVDFCFIYGKCDLSARFHRQKKGKRQKKVSCNNSIFTRRVVTPWELFPEIFSLAFGAIFQVKKWRQRRSKRWLIVANRRRTRMDAFLTRVRALKIPFRHHNWQLFHHSRFPTKALCGTPCWFFPILLIVFDL